MQLLYRGMPGTYLLCMMSLTVGGGIGPAATNPAALKMDWSLRYNKPLITPSRSAPSSHVSVFACLGGPNLGHRWSLHNGFLPFAFVFFY